MTRIEVKDFGPIAKAAVDLKPLTLFMGPNNSGKSYLALAIYCLSRTVSREGSLGRTLMSSHFPTVEFMRWATAEVEKASSDLMRLPLQPTRVGDLPSSMQRVVARAFEESASALASDFGDEIQRCYGTGIRDLIRRGLPGDGTFRITLSETDSSFSWDMLADYSGITSKEYSINLAEHVVHSERHDLPGKLLNDPEYMTIRLLLGLNFMPPIGLKKRPHYLPASRSGIILSHRAFATMLTGQLSKAWIRPIEIPRLPGVITDLLQAIDGIEATQPLQDKLSKIVSFLEQDITEGIVSLHSVADYPQIQYENQAGQFLMHQASSMVSELASIVLYLKHLVRQGDLLIIEEPESHLDAHNQRRLARAIVMLVNAGVQVLITTHSDYFVNQINNLLLLHEVKPQRRSARKYSASEVLDPSRVGAYLFHATTAGSLVENLGVTAGGGIPISQFTDEHSALYDEAIALEHAGE